MREWAWSASLARRRRSFIGISSLLVGLVENRANPNCGRVPTQLDGSHRPSGSIGMEGRARQSPGSEVSGKEKRIPGGERPTSPFEAHASAGASEPPPGGCGRGSLLPPAQRVGELGVVPRQAVHLLLQGVHLSFERRVFPPPLLDLPPQLLDLRAQGRPTCAACCVIARS